MILRIAASLVLVVSGAGCSDALITYPLEGQLYDPKEDCLDLEGVLDVIEGEAVGTCEGVRCFFYKTSGDYIVTEQCTPPPGYEDQTAVLGGGCEAALAAYGRGDEGICLPTDD